MLQSVLDNSIEYIQEKNIEKNDIDVESPVYHLRLFQVEVGITLGTINNEFSKNGILYCPVYLIINKNNFEKIGYYEFYSSELSVLLDKEGDMDVSVMEGPLLFDYVDIDYLNNLIIKSTFLREFIIEDEKINEEDDDIQKQKLIQEASKIQVEEKKNQIIDNLSVVDNIEKILQKYDTTYNNKINEKTLVLYKKDVKSSIITQNSNWLQTFYNNNKFNIHDNEGDSNSLFRAIKHSLDNIDITIGIESLKAILVKNLTKEHYENYQKMYNDLASQIREHKTNIDEEESKKTELVETYNKIKAETETEAKSDTKNLQLIKTNMRKLNEIKKTLTQNGKLNKSKNVVYKKLLKNIDQFKFMRNVETLEDFKTIIMSNNYWPDSYAISILEYILNVKFIILNKKSYNANDMNDLIICNNDVLNKILEKKDFKPRYYILMNYDVETKHYNLVTYKSKKIFSFYEIPYPIKESVVDNCMQTNAGIYNLIPFFVEFKNQHLPFGEIKSLIETANSKLLENKVDEYESLSSDLFIPLSKMTSKRLSFLPTLISVAEAKVE